MQAWPAFAGIPEDLLVGQLEALAPQSARDLLSMLVAAGLLRMRTAAAAAVRHEPPSIFGPGQQTRMPSTVCIRQDYYTQHARWLGIPKVKAARYFGKLD